MRILIDVMGGDKAPLEMLRGAAMARKEFDDAFVLIGDTEQINQVAAQENIDLSGFEVVPAPSVVHMEDDPFCVTRAKKDSSMAVGLKMLSSGEGDAFVSTGNTGALFLGSSLYVRPIKGIHRAAIGTILPLSVPVLLLDSGANVVVTPDYLTQFALMGSLYMKNFYGIENPRVGLLNNGAEECKGTPVQTDTYKLLTEMKDIHFVGNIEANRVAFDTCDVLVADGFTGNVFLKSIEGTGKYLISQLKTVFKSSPIATLAALMVKKQLKAMKKNLDPNEAGGAPLLGLKKTVIKAHGSSDAIAFKNAIRQAIVFSKTDFIEELTNAMTATEQETQNR